MIGRSTSGPVFRFAPSPNGFLHLGHAYSALLNQRLARAVGGHLLLRIEDIDIVRCRSELVAASCEDLRWIGFDWDEPPLRQSQHFGSYRAVLGDLQSRGLVYPCFCSRKEVAARVAAAQGADGKPWPRDPDGAPLYPGTCRSLSAKAQERRIAAGDPYALRLDLGQASAAAGMADLSWEEWGEGRIAANVSAWGDVVLGRKDVPASYHLCCVLDDDRQGISDVVRGRDLFHATAIQRLLQRLLGLKEPFYRHHPLITDDTGQKLAKSKASTPLRQLRAEGWSARDVRDHLDGLMPSI